MIYAVSDLHGCYDKFRKLLDMIRLTDDDVLYVLGDVVDRGPENIRLVTELAGKRNICTLMGNHDYTAALMMKTYGMDHREKSSLQDKRHSRSFVFDRQCFQKFQQQAWNVLNKERKGDYDFRIFSIGFAYDGPAFFPRNSVFFKRRSCF